MKEIVEAICRWQRWYFDHGYRSLVTELPPAFLVIGVSGGMVGSLTPSPLPRHHVCPVRSVFFFLNVSKNAQINTRRARYAADL
jgi:hypothetical protein